MPYDITDDPYIDPKTGILRNKIKAKTQSALDRAEADITYIAIFTLSTGSRVGSLKFDAALLKDVNKEIFYDIYEWAGEYRTYDISKGNSYFAHAAYIESSVNDLFGAGVENDKDLLSRNRDRVVGRLAHYYGELNAIHPFREGNGRTARTFLRLLALRHGYDIEWLNLDPQENIQASIEAMSSGNERLVAMIDKLVVDLSGVDTKPSEKTKNKV